jgi:predicted nucleic acid-binding protein
MTRVALDTNILIYAELEPDSDKGQRAADLILRVSNDGVIPVQALGEYLHFIRRRAPSALGEAMKQTTIYCATFLAPATTGEIISAAAELAREHHMQLWDAVVCATSAAAGAKVLLSEDMQDGRVLNGLRIINPFEPANDATLDAILEG